MLVVKNLDLLIVKFETILADYDRETLSNLYQPIIGYEAMGLYFTLWSEATNQKVASITNHEDILARMQISMTDFIKARRKLEAVGLLTTKVEKGKDASIYTYHIYAPRTPFQFFDDTLFYGLLVKNVGEKTASRLKSIYYFENDNNDGEDITASFGAVFHPDFNDPIFSKVSDTSWNSLGRKSKKVNLEFSYEGFFEQLEKISQINESAFTKKDMKEISRMASLYGVDEISAAEIISSIYDQFAPKGERLDFDKINKAFQDETHFHILNKKNNQSSAPINSDTDMAKLINNLETIAPKDYLFVLQNGTKPCTADLKIIDSLSKDYNLNNGVINVIVSFVLEKTNNILSKAYVEKVAASIARSNIKTAIDAMNFLNDNRPTQDNKKTYTNKEETSNKGQENKVETKEDNIDLEAEWNKLFEDND